MSKVYDALQNAYREKKGDENLPEILSRRILIPICPVMRSASRC